MAYTGDSPREDGKNGGDSRSICGLCTQWYVIKCVCVGDSRGRDCCVELSVRAVKRRKENGAQKEYEVSILEKRLGSDAVNQDVRNKRRKRGSGNQIILEIGLGFEGMTAHEDTWESMWSERLQTG